MSAESVSAAQEEIDRARVFGRKPASWATEAVDAEASGGMSEAEAEKVLRGRVFGRQADPSRTANAREVAQAAVPSASTVNGFSRVVGELAQLAESRLGYDRFHASLYAKSEALGARQQHDTLEESLESLTTKRDELLNRPKR